MLMMLFNLLVGTKNECDKKQEQLEEEASDNDTDYTDYVIVVEDEKENANPNTGTIKKTRKRKLLNMNKQVNSLMQYHITALSLKCNMSNIV